MAGSTMFGMVASLTIAGTALGVHLGRSAIAEIDPFYFSQPATRFHSDLIANRPNYDEPPVRLVDASLIQGLGTGCIKCVEYPEEYHPIQDPAVESAWVGEIKPSLAVQPLPADDQLAAAPGDTTSTVARYTSYPVTEEDDPETEEEGQPVEALEAPATAQQGESVETAVFL